MGKGGILGGGGGTWSNVVVSMKDFHQFCACDLGFQQTALQSLFKFDVQFSGGNLNQVSLLTTSFHMAYHNIDLPNCTAHKSVASLQQYKN